MTTATWNGTSTADWSIAADWSTGTVPDATIDVQLGGTTTYTTTITTAQAANSVTLNDATATLLDSASLTLAGALTLTAGTFNLDTTGSLGWSAGNGTVNVASGATFHATGTHTLDNVQFNLGSVSASGAFAMLSFDALTLGSNAVVALTGGVPATSTSTFEEVTGTSLTNNGTIEALQGYASGLIYVTTLVNTGSLINASTSGYTVEATNITNTGLISASNGGGIGISGFNSFTNSGTITDNGGVAISSLNFVNNGTINVGGTNSYLALDGNGPTATPIAGTGTINLTGAADNLEFIQTQTMASGTINLTGTGDTIAVVSSATNAPGGPASSVVTLGAATVINQTAGTASIIASAGGPGVTDTLINNGTINLSASAGSLTVSTTDFTNNGTVAVSNGDHLVIQTTLDGTGSVTLASGASVEIGAAAAATDQITFTDGQNDVLKLDTAATFASTINGFNLGDTIDLAGQVATSATWANGVLTVALSGGTSLNIALAGNYAGASFKVASDGAGGTNITLGQAVVTPPSTIDSWKTPVSGNWSGATNWSTGAVPTSANDVQIGGSTAYTVTLDATASVNSLTIGDTQATLQNALPAATGTLSVTGALNNAGTIDLGGGAGGGWINAGSLTNTGTMTAVVALDGGLPGGAVGQTNVHFIDVTGTFTNAGVLSSDAGNGVLSEVLVTAGQFTNTGTVRSASGAGGFVELNTTNGSNTDTVTNNGTFITTNGGGIGVMAPFFVNNGQINLAGGNDNLEISSAYKQGPFTAQTTTSGSGTITLSGAGSTVRFIDSQTFASGTIALTGAGATLTDATDGNNVATPSTLTFGAASVINVSATSADITSWYNTSNHVIENGTINASAAGGLLTINPGLFTNNGTIAVSNGDTVKLGAATDGTGSVTLAGGAKLEVAAALAATDQVTFVDAAADTLKIDTPSAFAATINGFALGDTIDLGGVAATAASWAAGVLAVQTGSGVIDLSLAGSYAGSTFSVASDGSGGSLITLGGATPPPPGTLAGSFALTTATEGTATSTTLATFNDSNTADAAAGFTALITWGDGTTSLGTVTGSNGSFTVTAPAGHVYAAEGSYAASVLITRTIDKTTLTLGGAGSVTVGEGDSFAAKAAPTLAATLGQTFTGTLASFTDSYTGNTAADLSATINWGDGTTSQGTVTDINGVIAVSGSHVWSAAGSDQVTVTLKDIDGTASAQSTASATVGTPANTGQTFTLTTAIDKVAGGSGNNTIIAATSTLSKGDLIDGGVGGTNTLKLAGGGTFNLANPTKLTDVQIVTAQEGAGAARETVTLRNGLNVVVNVASGATAGSGITINGANDASTINLGKGTDTVKLGSAAETVNGGAGNDTFNVTAATIGATIHGGTGHNTLAVSGGGTATMGANITHVGQVNLAASGNAWNFTANATAGLVVNDLSSGQNDVIHAGAAGQTLMGGGVDQTFVGFGLGTTTYADSAAQFNGSFIRNFSAGDLIDVTGLAFSNGTGLSFSASGAGVGDLNVTQNGVFQTQIQLFGSFGSGHFTASSDGHGGTLIAVH